jgi:hypothetical protein
VDQSSPPNGNEIRDAAPLPSPIRQFDERRHHAETASKITFVLLWITALSVFAHSAVVIVSHFLGRPDVANALSEVFRVWIPLLAGFLGSALAYYFAQRGQ